MSRAGQKVMLADLREKIGRMDGGFVCRPFLPFGVSELDSLLPSHGLALGTLHEVVEGGAAAEFAGAATLFVAGIAARLKGPVLWCLRRRDLFAPGLAAAGLHPSRVIYANTYRDREIVPVMEEGLRDKGLGLVVGEVTRLGLKSSRRLQLAAEASGVPVIVIRRWWNVTEKELTTLPNVATTRWRITPYASADISAPGLGRARWQVDLLRCRGAENHSWILEACDEKGRLALPSDVADRSHPATPRWAAAG